MRFRLPGLILIPLLSGCSVFGVNSVEEARYDVLQLEDKYEVRLYQPMVVVETVVEDDFDNAGDIAFRRLFNYISRENAASSKIAMTAPVIANQTDADTGEKIDMTVPVLEERKGKGWRYMFVLPADYSMETAPAPLDENVKLSTIPRKKVAVIRFSGFRDEKIINEKPTTEVQYIKEDGPTRAVDFSE